MEGSFHDSENPSPPQWNSSPPRRNHNYFNDQGNATTAADGPNSYRSLASRRRRILGRLTRAGSDPRSMSNSLLNSDGPEAAPETLLKTPSKRKASSHAKSGKPMQFSASVNSLNAPTSEPPIIKMEDIASPNHSVIRSNPLQNLRELMDTSDDDLDPFELSMFETAATNDIQPPRSIFERQYLDLNSRNRIAEYTQKRQDTGRISSAILVSREQTPQDVIGANTGAERVRYLPLCPTRTPGRFETTNSGFLTVLQGHRDFVQRMQQGETQSNAVWPLNELPVELFDLITTHLARDDVKSMRLVNREFEQKVSRSLFHTSVVPFNTEIYDMIDEDRKTVSRTPAPRSKGKGKMKAVSDDVDDSLLGSEMGGLQWQNAKEDREGKVYKGHGLRVFQGFGPHIKRFGMSFEISEKQLSRPPIKKELDHIESYYGSYDWPSVNYARFATLAGLENTADETSRMKAAFSNLEIVQELALSVDSGLGWLNGPDKSLHCSVFEQSSPVFGSSYKIPDHATQAARKFWVALQQSLESFDPHLSLKEANLDFRALPNSPTELEGLRGSIYSNTELWSVVDRSKLSPALNTNAPGFGILYITSNQQASDLNLRFPLMPGDLTKEQREWLLETQWAQQAFLESYMLAVIDNPITFSNVTTLNIAKLSSRFLPMLAREVFWEALPCLSEVILLVSADWRNVEKDDAGFAQIANKYPSEAARVFHREILQGRIAPKNSIKKLKIGWVGGGEQAEGMFARNSNILPVPLTRPDHCTANSSMFGIVFEHVEHLTLSNCWITPPTLEGLVKSHSNKALKKLTLDSVSLTAHPKFPNNVQGAGAQQFAQAMAAVQAQLANNVPGMAQQQQGIAQFIPGVVQQQQQQQGFHPLIPANMQPMQAQQLAMMQQQLHQQMQQMQQANINPGILVGQLVQNGGLNTNNLNANDQTRSHWTAGHREGSWPQLLNDISPGPIFDDYLPAPAPWEEQPLPRAETNLRTLEFKSCGYAKLPNHTGFDQLVLEAAGTHRQNLSQWFRTRYSSFKSAMMATNDRNMGQIVQYMPQRELDALQFAWGFTEGWKDRSKAEEPEFDGFLCGGTGRFSGVIEKDMGLVGPRETSGTSSAGVL